MDLGHTQTARDLFTQAIQQATTQQDRARATLDLAGLCLSAGEFAQGWALFEARRDLLAPPHCATSMAQWDGCTTTGAVLLYAEQGLGDALQCLRYVELAAQKARVSLLVPQSMHALVRCLLPQWGERVQLCLPEQAGHAEACCSLLSLPQRLGVASFCLAARSCVFCRASDAMCGGGGAGGLCWSGNPGYQFDRRRSLAPALLGGLAAVKGVSFQALQPCSRLEGVPLALSPLPVRDLLVTARIIAGFGCGGECGHHDCSSGGAAGQAHPAVEPVCRGLALGSGLCLSRRGCGFPRCAGAQCVVPSGPDCPAACPGGGCSQLAPPACNGRTLAGAGSAMQRAGRLLPRIVAL
jgi:hypothetical protein